MPNHHPIDLLLIAYAFIAMPAYSIYSGRKLAQLPRDETVVTGRYWSIIARGFIISSIILLTWHFLDRPYTLLGLDLYIKTPGLIGFAIDSIIFLNIVYIVVLKKIKQNNISELQSRLRLNAFIPQSRQEFVLFPFVAIVGSISEEIFYRGYLIWAFSYVIGLWISVLLSSVAFGLAHAYQGGARVFQTTIIGLAFATGFALTHSLWWLMLGHIMINLTAYFYARKLNHLISAIR